MSKDLIQKVTPEEEFKPSPKQEEYLVTAVELMTDSPTKISESCNVSRQSWYRWIERPGFEDWFYSEYKRLRKRILPQLDALGFKYAKRGDFKFWEAMNQKIGELKTEGELRQSQAVQVNVPDAIYQKYVGDYLPEELNKKYQGGPTNLAEQEEKKVVPGKPSKQPPKEPELEQEEPSELQEQEEPPVEEEEKQPPTNHLREPEHRKKKDKADKHRNMAELSKTSGKLT